MPVSTATSDGETPLTSMELSAKMPGIRRGDKVALLYYDGVPVVTCLVKGSSLRDMLTSIYNGVRMKLDPSDVSQRHIIYQKISTFRNSRDRVRLMKLYESGKCRVYDLILNNYDFCDGNFKRSRNGIWTYSVGS